MKHAYRNVRVVNLIRPVGSFVLMKNSSFKATASSVSLEISFHSSKFLSPHPEKSVVGLTISQSSSFPFSDHPKYHIIIGINDLFGDELLLCISNSSIVTYWCLNAAHSLLIRLLKCVQNILTRGIKTFLFV